MLISTVISFPIIVAPSIVATSLEVSTLISMASLTVQERLPSRVIELSPHLRSATTSTEPLNSEWPFAVKDPVITPASDGTEILSLLISISSLWILLTTSTFIKVFTTVFTVAICSSLAVVSTASAGDDPPLSQEANAKSIKKQTNKTEIFFIRFSPFFKVCLRIGYFFFLSNFIEKLYKF